MRVAQLPRARIDKIFIENKSSRFGAIDSNISNWLQQEWSQAESIEVETHKLETHKDNQDLISSFGGEEKIISDCTLQPQHIKFLTENDFLQKNGFSNLFFVYSEKESKLFILGVVWDKTIEKYVPYIYRTHNLYRAWTKGNLVFIRKLDNK